MLIYYANRLRLCTHLFSEYLLDRDHYLEWLLSSLENCQLEKLPIWVLILQVYWDDLLQFRRYSRRLTAAILEKLFIVSIFGTI